MTSNHNTPQATVVTLDDVATPNLQRYVHPSAEAVAAMTAAHDPAARRRRF